MKIDSSVAPWMWIACGVALWLGHAPLARARDGHKRLFAIVVGSNQPAHPEQKMLSYADDDAIRNFEVLGLLGADAVLLAQPDRSTYEKYLDPARKAPHPLAEVVALARKPTADILRAALREVFARIASARKHGHETEFYFWYSGHGALRGASGVLSLEDGQVFTRSDLYENVLRASPADFNHVFIDACGASAFISSRGGSDRQPTPAQLSELVESYVQRESLQQFQNVGVLFGATSRNKVHEWPVYEGGVFSFELRSALLNAADIHGDRRVSYFEAYTFLAAANQAVQGDTARMEVIRRVPHGQLNHIIADWRDRPVKVSLALPGGNGRHIRVLDDAGTPLVETNKDLPDRAELVLPARLSYSAQLLPLNPVDATDGMIELGVLDGRVSFDPSPEDASSHSPATRGDDVAPALQSGLFRVPYGLTYYRGALSTVERGDDRPAPVALSDRSRGLRRWSYVLLAGAGAASITGLGCWLASEQAYQEYQRSEEDDSRHWQETTRRWDWAATASWIAAGAAAASAGAVWMFGVRLHGSPSNQQARSAQARLTVRF